MEELGKVAKSMAKEKSPGADNISIEFFTTFWSTFGLQFTRMINLSQRTGTLPPGMTRGLITLIFKAGAKEELLNWRPISLLQVSYKILTKTLQLRFQPLLAEVIDADQTAFLPLCFILDNVMVVNETIQWAKESVQPMIFLKLDYMKAYDTID